MSKWDYSVCGTGHAFQYQFHCLITLFFASLQSTEKMKEKNKSTALGGLDSSDSPCGCFAFFKVCGHSKRRESIRFTIRALCATPRWREHGRGDRGPLLSHSVTDQLSPSSEVVNEHRHTVRTDQVVWISRERFVLPGFGITCRK